VAYTNVGLAVAIRGRPCLVVVQWMLV